MANNDVNIIWIFTEVNVKKIGFVASNIIDLLVKVKA